MKNEKEIREQDYQKGLVCETKIFDKLQKMGYIVEPTQQWSFYDCTINDKYMCEIKKRFNTKNQYTTTILPWSKILEYNKVKKHFKNLILIFSFEDGDFYTSYNHLARMKHKLKLKPLIRNKGFQHKSRLHLHIPIDILKPLNAISLKS